MIVSCPSCGTRYHHHSKSLGEAAIARCSCCDDMVPLVVAGRPYVILPTSTAERGGLPIGMDDPRLAEQLEQNANSCGIVTDEYAPDLSNREWIKRFSGANGSAPAIFNKRRSKVPSPKVPRQPDEAEQTQDQIIRRSSKTLEVTVTVMLTAVGAATAHFSAVEQGLSPLIWAVSGGGLGLCMAWICVKWTRRR